MIIAHVFRWFLRILRLWLSASLLTLHPASTTTKQSGSVEDSDIDPSTGCIPPAPLAQLSYPYDIWEDCLEDAQAVLCLGGAVDPEIIGGGREGAKWRSRIRAVSCLIALEEVYNISCS
jgi:hypothetical protein